jgi:hypothetical protein
MLHHGALRHGDMETQAKGTGGNEDRPFRGCNKPLTGRNDERRVLFANPAQNSTAEAFDLARCLLPSRFSRIIVSCFACEARTELRRTTTTYVLSQRSHQLRARKRRKVPRGFKFQEFASENVLVFSRSSVLVLSDLSRSPDLPVCTPRSDLHPPGENGPPAPGSRGSSDIS